MAHPQSSPRQSIAAKRLDIGSLNIQGNSTSINLSGGIQISAAQVLTADSTGIVHANPVAALPGAIDGGVQWTLVSNSTGVAMAINTTGTTWKYLNVTSLQPT